MGYYIPYFWSYVSHKLKTIMSIFDVFSLKMTSFRTQILMRLFILISKSSVIISGAELFFTFNISVASIWRLCWCIVTELSSSKRSLKISLLSWYTNLKAHSCILLIPLSNCLLWNIQIKEHPLNKLGRYKCFR